jgi:predicted nucleic acid-binding protein
MRSILLDTGAIVGLLRPNDRHHERAREFFAALRPTDLLLTTWPVITECAFLMRRAESAYWEWLLDSEIQVAEFALDDVVQAAHPAAMICGAKRLERAHNVKRRASGTCRRRGLISKEARPELRVGD